MDDGERPIADPAELAHTRRQARRVWVKTFAFAGVLTAALWIAPT